jgi:hypothetical protein
VGKEVRVARTEHKEPSVPPTGSGTYSRRTIALGHQQPTHPATDEEENAMYRHAHLRVATLAAEAMPPDYTAIMAQLWDGIDTGATLPDEIGILWDTDEQEGVINRVLMHRCYMDSDKPRDRGCPIQIARYATGIPGFFDLWASGGLSGDRPEDAYDEEEFFVNAGSYLGVVAHHIADLHTPVHVGRNLDLSKTGYRQSSGFHSRVDADMDRAAKAVEVIRPHRARPVELTSTHFEHVAQQTYDDFFLKLPEVYSRQAAPSARAAFLAPCVVNAAKLTVDTWVAILRSLTSAAKASVGLCGT